jgi:hypothetical protein
MSSILEISGLIPGSFPSLINDSMNSRSLFSRIIVVLFASSFFSFGTSGLLRLASCIEAIATLIFNMPCVFRKYIYSQVSFRKFKE